MSEKAVSGKDGIDKAVALTTTLMKQAQVQGLVELEKLCKNALNAAGKEQIVVEHYSTRLEERKLPEIAPGLTPTHAKNFSGRFGMAESLFVSQRQTWFPSGLFAGVAASEHRIYEDITDPVVLAAPITDICLVHKTDPIPDGFYRLSKTLSNRKATLNYKSGGNEIYVCIKKDPAPNAAFVTSLIVIFPDKNEIYPPGFLVVRRGNQVCNVNTGTSAERIFLCYKKERSGSAITDLLVMFPGKQEFPPKNYNLLETSPSGIPANLNAGTGGGRVYLCYRQLYTQYLCLENELDGQIIPPQGSPLTARITARKKGSNSEYGMSTIIGQIGTPSPSPAEIPSFSPGRCASPSPLLNSESQDDPTLSTARTAAVEAVQDSTLSRKYSDKPIVLGDSVLRTVGGASPRLPREDSVNGGLPDEPNPEEEEVCAMVTDRRQQVVTDSEGNLAPRTARLLLLALLVGASVRQINISVDVINGILSLLNNSDFFKPNLVTIAPPHLLTMLDLAVEAICDRIGLCQKVELPLLLDFVLSLVKKSKGKLSQGIIRRLFVSLSTLLTFHCGLSRWLANNQTGPCLDDGSPFQESGALDELIVFLVGQIENEPVVTSITAPVLSEIKEEEFDDLNNEPLCRAVVLEFIDDIIDSVETCKLCDTAQALVASQTTHVASNYFWTRTSSIARVMYPDDSNRNSFSLLCALCRLAWPAITVSETGTISSRELGTKLLALDMLLTYCSHAGEKMNTSKVNGYQIRRLVVPCILNNISFALREPRVFTKIMKLISCLWITWRVHLRIEFANLCEQLCIRILQASVIKVRPIYQMVLLNEMEIWLGQPQLMLEMFVNFDMDNKFVSHWNIFTHLIRAMCTISKRPDNVIGINGPKQNGQDQNEGQQGIVLNHSVSVREVNMKSMEEVAHVAKTLMDATGHAFLMTQDMHFRTRSVTMSGGWEQEEDEEENVGGTGIDTLTSTVSVASLLTEDESSMLSPTASSVASVETPALLSPGSGATPSTDLRSRTETGSPAPYAVTRLISQGEHTNSGEFQAKAKRRMSNVSHMKQQHQKAEELVSEAVRLYEQSGSLKKALAYLIKKNFIANTPQEIAGFLRVYKNSFDPSAIGDYLGEGGVSPAEQEYWSQIRYRYVRAISFVEMELEPALRLYLTGCGFRLPGEAQKIDRFVETFQMAYWADNHGTQNCPLKHSDTVHILAFAVIMLNTDLHRASAGPKNKKRVKMTKEEFINNLRGSDKGDNIDKDYLSRIYDNIAAQPIELQVSAAEAGEGSNKSMVAATGGVGINMGGAGSQNGASAASSGNSNSPSSSAQPAAAAPALEFSPAGEKSLVTEVARNVRDSEDLLRTLSQRTYPFSRTGIDTKLSLELVSFMFETVWLYFRDLTEVLLGDNAKFDTNITLLAVDILCSSLTSAIFLGLNMERRVLSERLEKFQQACAKQSVTANTYGHPLLDVSWRTKVTNCKKDTTMETIAEVHKMISVLKEVIQETENYEISKTVAARIEKKAKVMEKNIYFVRENDMLKANRHGRPDPYRFFLFSDTLLYCHQAMLSGEYIVHEQLTLKDMSVSDNVDDNTDCSLKISHPIKSFTLLAESPQLKRAWLRDLQQTIFSCKQRVLKAQIRVQPSVRKLSVVDRIEEQKKTIEERTLSARKIRFASEDDSSNPQPTSARSTGDLSSSTVSTGDTNASNEDAQHGAGVPTAAALASLLADDDDEEDDDALRMSDIDVDVDVPDAASVASSVEDEPSAPPTVRRNSARSLTASEFSAAAVSSLEEDTNSASSADVTKELFKVGIDEENHDDVESGFQQSVRLHPPSNPSSPDHHNTGRKLPVPASMYHAESNISNSAVSEYLSRNPLFGTPDSEISSSSPYVSTPIHMEANQISNGENKSNRQAVEPASPIVSPMFDNEK
jgi:hypothetical protein